jgi:ankyrin repeat protein
MGLNKSRKEAKIIDSGMFRISNGVADSMSQTTGKSLTPLMRAAAIGHMAVVKGLLAEGVDVNDKGPRDSTALMFAAGAGHLEVVRELVRHGAEVDAVENSGMTAVRLAQEDGYKDIADYLASRSRAFSRYSMNI